MLLSKHKIRGLYTILLMIVVMALNYILNKRLLSTNQSLQKENDFVISKKA